MDALHHVTGDHGHPFAQWWHSHSGMQACSFFSRLGQVHGALYSMLSGETPRIR